MAKRKYVEAAIINTGERKYRGNPLASNRDFMEGLLAFQYGTGEENQRGFAKMMGAAETSASRGEVDMIRVKAEVKKRK